MADSFYHIYARGVGKQNIGDYTIMTSTKNSKCIISRMSHIYDMYRLVKIVQNETRKNDRRNPPPEQFVGFSSRHPATIVVKKRFVKYHPLLTSTDAGHIVADSINREFIEGVENQLPDSNIKVDTLCVRPKGRVLIERTWIIFPTGLWSAWREESGKGFIALMSAIISLLTAVFLLLADIVFFGKNV